MIKRMCLESNEGSKAFVYNFHISGGIVWPLLNKKIFSDELLGIIDYEWDVMYDRYIISEKTAIC